MGHDDKRRPAPPRQDEQNPAATEIDLRLPADIAVRHAEVSFDSKETLPLVELPNSTSEARPRRDSAPPFDPDDFPAPRPASERTTEHVDLSDFTPRQAPRGASLRWALLGAAIAFAFAAALYLLVLR